MVSGLYKASDLLLGDHVCEKCDAVIWIDCPRLSFIREYGSTLYVGLARAVSPINTNFRLTFLLTRIQRLFMKT